MVYVLHGETIYGNTPCASSDTLYNDTLCHDKNSAYPQLICQRYTITSTLSLLSKILATLCYGKTMIDTVWHIYITVVKVVTFCCIYLSKIVAVYQL